MKSVYRHWVLGIAGVLMLLHTESWAQGTRSCSPTGCDIFTRDYIWQVDDTGAVLGSEWSIPDNAANQMQTNAGLTRKYPPAGMVEILLSWGVTLNEGLAGADGGSDEQCLIQLSVDDSTTVSTILVGPSTPTNATATSGGGTGVACTTDSGNEPFASAGEWCSKDFADETVASTSYWNVDLGDPDGSSGNNDCTNGDLNCECDELRSVQIHVRTLLQPE